MLVAQQFQCIIVISIRVSLVFSVGMIDDCVEGKQCNRKCTPIINFQSSLCIDSTCSCVDFHLIPLKMYHLQV